MVTLLNFCCTVQNMDFIWHIDVRNVFMSTFRPSLSSIGIVKAKACFQSQIVQIRQILVLQSCKSEYLKLGGHKTDEKSNERQWYSTNHYYLKINSLSRWKPSNWSLHQPLRKDQVFHWGDYEGRLRCLPSKCSTANKYLFKLKYGQKFNSNESVAQLPLRFS